MSEKDIPEFSGYNTVLARENSSAVKPRKKAVYLPLVDMSPAEPSMMLTAMKEAQRMTSITGQEYTIFTNDQQLYKIVVGITWVYENQFLKFIPRFGGMHTMMSFVGAIGTIMAESGLKDIMESSFGGVSKMLIGKKFPQNVRALRIIAEELLRSVFEENVIKSHADLLKVLELKACMSRTSKLWIGILIKPVFLMMNFVRAEREGDWPLHLYATQEFMPYLFAAGHFNYARYCLYYLISMAKLPKNVLKIFMEGNHVMRHQLGLWNGIWSDMYIESTFMWYGHGPGGIIGITLKPSTLKRWAYGFHLRFQIKSDVVSLVDGNTDKVVDKHKEEGKSRIKADGSDRKNIHQKLSVC